MSLTVIGQTIGHYRIVDKLGEGGMGVVYKARDAHLDRFVAVKTLLPGRVSDPERKRRFVREAKAASALNHPNIVAIYDIDQAEGLDYIAMEYVSGKTLDELIPRKGMRLSLALKYAVQIADALARAHSAGIVHRDLKPSNVMVDEHGVVKVLDFGLAKLIETGPTGSEAATRSVEATEARTVVGTVAYMSPEQAEGKEVDARSDIFAFGSLLYEMVSGRRAYEGTSATSTLAAVLHQEPKPLEDVPHDLDRAIARCLRKDPARRWQTMADLRVALQELCEESDSQPPGVAAPAIRRYRHRLLVALIALPLLVVAGWLYVNGSGHRLPPPALVQLTSSPGWEGYPSFSPDGRQVAFTWNGEKEDNVDIYVKLVGETTALRLTSDPAPESWPAWSPDGKRIAFERAAPGAPGIWLVSPLGGAEQKLADLETAGQMAWSPDGKWLAVGLYGSGEKTRGIVLVPVDGGEARRVTAREALGVDVDPSFSPDGRLLAYASCITLYSCDVFVQPLDAGYAPRGGPQRITQQSLAIDGLAWSHDGGSLIYGGSFSWNLSYRLWRVERSGGQQPERVDLAGPGASAPAVAPAGRRLAFSKSTSNLDVWRYQLGGVPEPFLRSSLVDMVAQFSPDGSRIVFASDRAGDVCDLWTVGADGSLPVQLTRGPGLAQSSPRWSPDGRLIAYDSRERDGVIRIYVIDANGGRPRRVSSVEPANAFVPSWSRDGKRIYFCSDRTGRGEVWRASLDGGAAEQVTENGGGLALESTDGRTLFYTKIPPRIQGRFSPDPSMAVPNGKSWISSSTIHSPSSGTGSTTSAGPVPTSSILSSSTSSRPVPEASSRRLQARFFSRT